MAVQNDAYPITYTVDTPETLSRWLWLVKWLLAIPHFIIVGLLGYIGLITLFISWVVILVTGKRPRGLFNFHLGIMRWSMRVNGYVTHIAEGYPRFTMDEEPEYPIRMTAEYEESANRLTTFFRYLLSIPHFLVLWILSWIAGIAWLIHIIVVIVTGKPHSEIFNFLVGVNRWQARANGYFWLLTDRYPPFSLD